MQRIYHIFFQEFGMATGDFTRFISAVIDIKVADNKYRVARSSLTGYKRRKVFHMLLEGANQTGITRIPAVAILNAWRRMGVDYIKTFLFFCQQVVPMLRIVRLD